MSQATTSAPQGRRPRDRADRILEAAAPLFRKRGFHGVSMDDIGEVVGISGPAVYRHFPTKHEVLLRLAERSQARVTSRVRQAFEAHTDPREQLQAVVGAGISATVEDRDLAATFLQESRHLTDDPALPRLRDEQRAAARMHLDAIQAARPELTHQQARFLLQSISGLAMSVLQYDSSVSCERISQILTEMGVRAILAPSFPDKTEEGREKLSAGTPLRRRRREVVLNEAIRLFHQYGYGGVGIDEIGAAAGITGPGIYRHFRSKEDILAAACGRVIEQLRASAASSRAMADTVEEALSHLVTGYIQLVMHSPELLVVFLTELHALPDELRDEIREGDESYVAEWTALIRQLYRRLSAPEATVMANGALGLLNGYALGTGFGEGRVFLSADRAKRTLTDLALVVLIANPGIS